MVLAPCQLAALEFVNVRARDRRANAVADRGHICRMCNLPVETMENTLQKIRRHARVALHFHPDRPLSDGRTVAESLLQEGIYRSHFETGISNGGVTAHAGGRRDVCEQGLFGGAYHAPGVEMGDRPKYGSLDLLGHAEGPSPRFGSCYLVLAAPVSQRCTLTYQDSHGDPIECGTIEEFDDVFAALLRDVFLHECALGERDLTVAILLDRVERLLANPVERRLADRPAKNLNQYIEAQVHGMVSLEDDADLLVVDPSFQGTTTAKFLSAVCERYGIIMQWHHGFRLSCDRVPRDFRGPTMPSLAKRVAPNGTLDASLIGDAVRALQVNSQEWNDRGTLTEVLQELKSYGTSSFGTEIRCED
jgi:Protein of unknown function (DUF3626)